MDLNRDKIVIDGTTYLAVPDDKDNTCDYCSLRAKCYNRDGIPCGLYAGGVHFVRQLDKKVYLSLPISGKDTYEIRRTLRKGYDYLRAQGYQIITPYDASPNANASYAEHMGKDIQALLECDVVLMMPGWEDCRGCQCEKATAEIYGKEIVYYADTE